MSIREQWRQLVAEGALHRLEPDAGERLVRTVLMTEEVRDLVLDWPDVQDEIEATRRAILLATLRNIVHGQRLIVCMEPYEARDAVLGRLEKVEDGIWDVRCRCQPGLRVFGGFLEKEVFFAVTARPRSRSVSWLKWLPLGDWDSKEWKDGIAYTRREWARFFPADPPLVRDNLDEYLSDASSDRNRRRSRR